MSRRSERLAQLQGAASLHEQNVERTALSHRRHSNNNRQQMLSVTEKHPAEQTTSLHQSTLRPDATPFTPQREWNETSNVQNWDLSRNPADSTMASSYTPVLVNNQSYYTNSMLNTVNPMSAEFIGDSTLSSGWPYRIHDSGYVGASSPSYSPGSRYPDTEEQGVPALNYAPSGWPEAGSAVTSLPSTFTSPTGLQQIGREFGHGEGGQQIQRFIGEALDPDDPTRVMGRLQRMSLPAQHGHNTTTYAASAQTTSGYSCGQCTRSFDTRSEMMHHARNHIPDDQRPFVCRFCNVTFLWQKDKTRHEKSQKHRRQAALSAPHVNDTEGSASSTCDTQTFGCPVNTCRFHIRGFARRDHYLRHMGTHQEYNEDEDEFV